MLTFDKHDSNSLVSGNFILFSIFLYLFSKRNNRLIHKLCYTLIHRDPCHVIRQLIPVLCSIYTAIIILGLLYTEKNLNLCVSGNLAPFWVKVLSWCLNFYFWSLIEIKSWTLSLAWILKRPVSWRQWREFCCWHNSTWLRRDYFTKWSISKEPDIDTQM